MTDALRGAVKIAASGLAAQSMRLEVVAQNLANANATASTPGGDPYARKTITFENEVDESTGRILVRVAEIGRDRTPFRVELDPAHPAADERGMVKLSNVQALVELADMREANRSYQASLQMVRQARDLINMTIDLLKVNS